MSDTLGGEDSVGIDVGIYDVPPGFQMQLSLPR